MDSPRTRFRTNHGQVAGPEAIGTSPQLRDDIHRVLSRANDAFEDRKALPQKEWQVWQVQAKFPQN